MEDVGKFVSYAALIILGVALDGYVLMKLWQWFVSPTFHVFQLSILQSVGLSTIVKYLKMSSKTKNKYDEEESVSHVILQSTAGSLFILVFGWIVSLFF